MLRSSRFLGAIALSVILAACGGGGGGSAVVPVTPVVPVPVTPVPPPVVVPPPVTAATLRVNAVESVPQLFVAGSKNVPAYRAQVVAGPGTVMKFYFRDVNGSFTQYVDPGYAPHLVVNGQEASLVGWTAVTGEEVELSLALPVTLQSGTVINLTVDFGSRVPGVLFQLGLIAYADANGNRRTATAANGGFAGGERYQIVDRVDWRQPELAEMMPKTLLASPGMVVRQVYRFGCPVTNVLGCLVPSVEFSVVGGINPEFTTTNFSGSGDTTAVFATSPNGLYRFNFGLAMRPGEIREIRVNATASGPGSQVPVTTEIRSLPIQVAPGVLINPVRGQCYGVSNLQICKG